MTPKTPSTFRTEICRALAEGLEADPRLILMGEDICGYGGAFAVTGDLHERFPDRVINTPISEGGFIGVATGAAVGGMRVVAEIMFMDFITLAMDQLVNHAAKLHYMYAGQVRVPLVVRTPFGGYRGYGPSHSQSLAAWFMNVPGLKVVAPGSAEQAAALLIAAIADDNPVLFLEHKLLYGEPVGEDGPDATAEIGKARIAREGENVSVITYGYGVRLAEQAAEHLTGEGIRVEIVDLVTLKPYDAETVFASVRKTGRAVFLEEGPTCAGVTAELCAAVAEHCLWDLDGGLARVGARDLPIPSSGPAERMVLPSPADVVSAVHGVMG
jgi:acetoin:2,6-dichlorophenolindophenol oxidoreductase subunit beta